MKESELKKKDFRYERKFVVPYMEESEIEQVIFGNKYIFKEIFSERQVNNIYLDNIDMTSFFDNVLGNPDRTKFRIRWYGDLYEVNKPVLEMKVKRGLVGTKLSFPLQHFKFPCGLDEIQEVFQKSKLPEWLLEILKNQRFALVNCYKRKYYMSFCKKFRITVDKDLTYYGVFNQLNLDLLDKVQEDFFILEVKYAVKESPEDITTKFPFRMTKSSKFVTGVSYFRGE